jgi:type VI secretion system protein ImpL
LYVANYVNAWESKIANIGISKASSLAEVDNLIVNFISKNASLLQLLQTIQHETGFAPITTVSPKLAAITQLMTPALDKPNGDLANIMLALTALHNELQTILQAADPGAAAFQSATAHMDDLSAQRDAINQLFLLAEKSPAPLKNWLENMTTTSWHYVLQETGHFIEKHWLAEVMAFYNTEIANRFPFTPTATTEVSLARFSQFLGSQGILAGFFQTYLQAFADNTGKNWTWKTVHHEHLPFSDLALNQLQHAAHIQHAFFADGQNQPQIRFALQPIKLSANTRNLQLNIDGQELQYHRAMPRLIKTITWPGSATRVTRVNLVADTNAALNDNSNSEWGWFRIVNKSTEKILTPKKLLLTLDVNGHQASLMLYSIGRINAFLPSNLQQFKLPEQLMV